MRSLAYYCLVALREAHKIGFTAKHLAIESSCADALEPVREEMEQKAIRIVGDPHRTVHSRQMYVRKCISDIGLLMDDLSEFNRWLITGRVGKSRFGSDREELMSVCKTLIEFHYVTILEFIYRTYIPADNQLAKVNFLMSCFKLAVWYNKVIVTECLLPLILEMGDDVRDMAVSTNFSEIWERGVKRAVVVARTGLGCRIRFPVWLALAGHTINDVQSIALLVENRIDDPEGVRRKPRWLPAYLADHFACKIFAYGKVTFRVALAIQEKWSHEREYILKMLAQWTKSDMFSPDEWRRFKMVCIAWDVASAEVAVRMKRMRPYAGWTRKRRIALVEQWKGLHSDD